MTEALILFFRQSLPQELISIVEPFILKLEAGNYQELLESNDAQALIHSSEGIDGVENLQDWHIRVSKRLELFTDRYQNEPQTLAIYFCIGYASLLAFLQSNVTGPPFQYDLIGSVKSDDDRQTLRKQILKDLSSDGISPYRLTPQVELLSLAGIIFSYSPLLELTKAARWARSRVQFVRQRLLSEVSSTLQNDIYDDLDVVYSDLSDDSTNNATKSTYASEFLIERAMIHVHHGLDKLAREDLEQARKMQQFDFALTGLLGKRTKFQEKDFSQLVVLAKSKTDKGENETPVEVPKGSIEKSNGQSQEVSKDSPHVPEKLDLNDDTLLESISFAYKATDSPQVVTGDALPPKLAELDPGNQPQLKSLDSTILLALASSITNTSPQDGLTREETLPYATRVLDSGSANWQVYTQALLIRSRIEGYKSRTVERGLLQLQVLVDQIIAETTGVKAATGEERSNNTATTFLPRAEESESAPATDRLRFIFQLASPTRWDLEAELAARWTSLGGLRSALDIYERLEMWAEAALCWAATEREDKARLVLRKQLFHATSGAEESPADDEKWTGPARDPPPTDAPRLYCILGDIDQSTEMYETAWTVSRQRYARAQRSLGRHYFTTKHYVRAAEAYSKSLKANQLNHGSWFALGCALLELQQFEKAAEAFSRCVQLDDTDAESWSNLAAALLRRGPGEQTHEASKIIGSNGVSNSDSLEVDLSTSEESTLQKNRHDALKALQRAAALKHDSFRIWENVLIVSASVTPPDYSSILAAQKNIISLRGRTEGEHCIDIEILELLIQHVITSSDKYDPTRPGLPRMVVKFIDESVIPLITGSTKLWRMASRLALWKGKPASALDAEEKAWRVITAQPGWESDSEDRWNVVVEATIRLCDSYESLGPQERTEGMSAGTPVAKDWRFKARTAIRGILGRGKANWEGTDGWERLNNAMGLLKV